MRSSREKEITFMAGNDTKNENKKKALDAAIAKLEKDLVKVRL